VSAASGEGPERARGDGSGTRRLGAHACKTCALGAPSARTRAVRQNAMACQRAPHHVRFGRSRLLFARRLVDMVVRQSKQVQCAN